MLGAQDITAVQDVQVLTQNYDAEFSRSSVGKIRFVTKSVTSEVHGELYEALRNAAFDANTWSRNSSSPFRRGNSVARTAVGGWAISGVNQFESGMAFSVREHIDYAGIGAGSGNQFRQVTGSAKGCCTSWVDSLGAQVYCTNVSSAPVQGIFATGDTRNIFNNPGSWEWCLALHKVFPIPINETSVVEFRTETFDCFKYPNRGNVVSNPVGSDFMMVNTKTDNRNPRFQLMLMP
jgi:hypothetical protein